MGLEISSTLRVPFLCVSTLFLVNSFYILVAGVPGLQHSSFPESFGQNKTAPASCFSSGFFSCLKTLVIGEPTIVASIFQSVFPISELSLNLVFVD